jgi:outer membrane protein OmpA-like peptidoglycan-associated protein
LIFVAGRRPTDTHPGESPVKTKSKIGLPLLGAAALTALCAVPSLAQETSVLTNQNRGFYIGAGAGANFQSDNDFRNNGTDSKAKYDPGYVALLNFGYALGNGLRFEIEPGYRRNGVDKINGAGADRHSEIASLMANAIYDFDLHTPYFPLVPHIGGGVGYARVLNKSLPHNGLTVSGQDDTIAFQGIAGVEYALTPAVKLGLDYRYFVAHDADFRITGTDAKSHVGDFDDHSVLLTVRYEFGAPRPKPQPEPAAYVPPPQPVPQAAPAAPPAAPRQYTTYFDFNSAQLSQAATAVVDDAAATARKGQVSRITVTGHADTVGSGTYNQRLSERRAQAVRAELVRQGVPADEIVTVGRGETELAVPTPNGVREPRNRRVEIVLQAPGA